jgi:hypothetical protein
MNNDYCCDTMQLWLQDLDCPLKYIAHLRFYSMSAPKSMVKKNEVWPGYTVQYCPNCGTQLPNHVVGEWMNILEKEYGIDNPYNPKQKKLIPQEFFTDKWWKKRGL